MSHFFSKAGGGFEGPVHRTRYIEIPFWSQLVDHDPSNEPDLDVFISIELPAPSNRSPPATFKSAKATRGDLAGRVLVYTVVCQMSTERTA